MRKTIKTAYSLLAWILMVIDACLLISIGFLIFVFTYPFDRKRKVVHLFSVYWGLHYYWLNPFWKIRYTCDISIDKSQPYIIVSNHQSMFDICSLYKVPLVFKWVSKVEALRIPFVGGMLKMHGDILIHRGDQQSTKRMLKDAAEWIQKGCSISIFPEGTRSMDGRIQDFKEGAFLVARLNKLPILPVVTDGNYELLHSGSGLLGGCVTVKMHVLPVIPAETVGSMKVKELSDLLHALMLEEHRKMAPHRYQEDKAW